MERHNIGKDMLNLTDDLFLVKTFSDAICVKMQLNGIEISMSCDPAAHKVYGEDRIFNDCEIRLFDVITNTDITAMVLKINEPAYITQGSEFLEILLACKNYK